MASTPANNANLLGWEMTPPKRAVAASVIALAVIAAGAGVLAICSSFHVSLGPLTFLGSLTPPGGGAMVVGGVISLLVSAIILTPKRTAPAPTIAVPVRRELPLQSMPVKVSVINEHMFERISDHAILIAQPQNGSPAVVSANVMCSGEDFDPDNANSFGIDPRNNVYRDQRFRQMFTKLDEALTTAGEDSVIALQEFPRVEATGLSEFTALAEVQFPGHQLYFGKVERSLHQQSQLCILVPRALMSVPHPIEFDDTRVQILQLGERVYINVHGLLDPDVHHSLQDKCAELLAGEAEEVHLVGGWNWEVEELVSRGWQGIHSAPKGVRTRVAKDETLPYQGSGGPPIDHYMFYTKQQSG